MAFVVENYSASHILVGGKLSQKHSHVTMAQTNVNWRYNSLRTKS